MYKLQKDEGTIGWIVENKEELLITDTLNDLRLHLSTAGVLIYLCYCKYLFLMRMKM